MDKQDSGKSKRSRIPLNEDGQPLCRRCESNVRLELTRRSTGDKYFWGYCRECENKRQAYGRLRRATLESKADQIGLSSKVVETLAEAEVVSIRDWMKLEDPSEIDGIGPKSVTATNKWLDAQEALDW